MRAAAIGIGSNSTRMLAAEIGEGTIAPLLRLREDTRLFSSLENGVLSLTVEHPSGTEPVIALPDDLRGQAKIVCRLTAAGSERAHG